MIGPPVNEMLNFEIDCEVHRDWIMVIPGNEMIILHYIRFSWQVLYIAYFIISSPLILITVVHAFTWNFLRNEVVWPIGLALQIQILEVFTCIPGAVKVNKYLCITWAAKAKISKTNIFIVCLDLELQMYASQPFTCAFYSV